MDTQSLQNALVAQDWEMAEELLSPYAEQAEAHASILYNYGKVLLELDRAEEASTAFLRAVRREPRHANAWFELGRAALATEAFSTAMEAFKKAAELMPNDPDSWRNLGRVALRLGAWDMAEIAWLKFANDPEADLALYRITAETGDPDAAERRAHLLCNHPDRQALLKTLARVSKGAIPLRF